MIDLDMMPPDWKFAENHAKANKPGLVDDLLNPNSSNVFCPCCLRPIIKSEVPLLNNSKQLDFMGFGFPLYFILIKYSIILLFILICSYSTVSLYWGITNNQIICHRRLLASGGSAPSCTSFFVKWSRIQLEVSGQEIIMRITSFLIHLLALIYIRDNILKTMEYYDQKTTSLSDYSLIIKNLPFKDEIQQNIKDFIHCHFKQKWEELKNFHIGQEFHEETKVMQITLLPQIDDYYKLLAQKNDFIEEKRKLYKKFDDVEKKMLDGSSQSLVIEEANILKAKIKHSNQKINLTNHNISQISKNYRALAKQDKLRSQIAIVTLNSEIFKSEVIEYGQCNKLNSELLGKYFGDFHGEIQIDKATQPSEIIWRNVNFSKNRVILSKIMGWLLSIVFIAIVTIGFYFLLLLKTKFLLAAIQQQSEEVSASSSMHYRMAVFLVFFDIIMIVLFNKLVMGAVLHYFTHLQLHFTTSDDEFSFALKYTLGLFFTTALMTLAVEAVTFHNFYAHEYGVIEEESIMFVINAFLIPLIWLVNPWNLLTLVMRKYKINRKYFTQRQANQIMSDTPYTMGKRYAQIIQSMWFTYLYATLIPVGAFFTVVGLALYYWIDKFNLIKRSFLNHNISGDLAVVSLKLLDFTLVLKPIGELIFDSQIRHSVQAESIVLLCIGTLYLVLPMDKILDFLHKEEFQPQEKSFNDVKDIFLQTYQTLHPILSFKALKIFDNLKKKTTRQISLNEIQITDMHLMEIMKDNGNKGFTYEYMNPHGILPQETPHNPFIQQVRDLQVEQEYQNYQSRTKNSKTASKNYFSHKRKESEHIPLQYLG